MLLVVAASELEMKYFAAAPVARLVCGVGPVEAACGLWAHLARNPRPTAVLNIGIAGAYVRASGQAEMLSLCLAEREELGDFGKCAGGRLEPLAEHISPPRTFYPDAALNERIAGRLADLGIPCRRGVFVTVNCASGDRERGDMLLARFPDALCENMEGAALARVCAQHGLPFAELRCISNLIDQPERQGWRLREACARMGEVARRLVQEAL